MSLAVASNAQTSYPFGLSTPLSSDCSGTIGDDWLVALANRIDGCVQQIKMTWAVVREKGQLLAEEGQHQWKYWKQSLVERPAPELKVLSTSLDRRDELLIERINRSLSQGHIPIQPGNSCGGSYIIENLGVYKPVDEEAYAPNNPKGWVGSLGEYRMRKGIAVGGAANRECAAYLLDYENFAGVPPTYMAELTHPILFDADEGKRSSQRLMKSKPGSFQFFVEHDVSAGQLFRRSSHEVSHESLQRIAILDIRLMNTDRHLENLLCQKTGNGWKLIPIDHGFCLPESMNEGRFGWLRLAQCYAPFEPACLDYIRRLDPSKDAVILREMNLPEKSITVSRRATWWLQRTAEAGWNLAEIAGWLQRPRIDGMKRRPPSQFEDMLSDVVFSVSMQLQSEGVELKEGWEDHYVDRIDQALLKEIDNAIVTMAMEESDYDSSFSSTYFPLERSVRSSTRASRKGPRHSA